MFVKYGNIISSSKVESKHMPLLTRKIRVIIMCSLITVFFVTAPLILLYTAGFRYNFSEQQIKRTGVLNIDAKPTNLEVTLNGVKQKNKLPLYLPNRAPGTYKIILSKPGYKSWEKDIVIASNQTTYIKNVTLFRSTLPVQILEEREAPLSVVFSPTAKYALLVSQDKNNKNIYEVDLYNPATDIINPIFRSRLNEQPTISWSPFAEFAAILTKQDNAYNAQIFDAGNPDTAPTYSFKTSITDYKWMKDSPGPALYARSNNAVYLLNSMEKKKMPNIDLNVIDSALEYSITRFEGNLQVTRIENNTNKETKTLSTPSTVYNAQTKEWLAWSPWELWTIYPNGTTALLNRTSDKINFVVPLDEYGLLLLASENKITGFNPGYYVTHELFSNGKIDSIGADIANRKIFFLGEVGGKRGVWELEY